MKKLRPILGLNDAKSSLNTDSVFNQLVCMFSNLRRRIGSDCVAQ